jgi:type IV secretion system protein VirB2
MDVTVSESPFTIQGGRAMKTSMVGRAAVERNQSQGGRAAMMKAASFLLGLAVLLEAHPAWAQISKVNQVMTNVQTVLVGVAVTLFTVAIMWAGFKMAFQQAQWSEISNVVIGGILVGGAAGIAAWLVN